jgi:Xaa-Pro aminopeptidase
MKKHLLLLIYLSIVSGCYNPGGRSWMIPVSIDPSDLVYTPVQTESFEMRRNQVIDSLNGAYVILKSWDDNSHNRHQFRPNNYFYYLTGHDGPATYAILGNDSAKQFVLSSPSQSIRALIYDGSQLSAEEIQEKYNPQQVLARREFMNLIDSILEAGSPIYIDRSDRLFEYELQSRTSEELKVEFRHIGELADEMRVFKNSMEVERIQKACDITALSMINVMRECKPNRYEFEMEAVIEGTFLEYGSPMPGFNSIVGSGPNSTTMHYEPNDRLMEDGDLLLMDIGAEYGYYTADITRTIPVNGRFSPEQRSIYQLVLEAQKAAIEQMTPGHLFSDANDAVKEVINKGLYDLKLITDPESPWQVTFYTIHGTSHFLGLDVHDVGLYRERELEPGMVLTIEPGIYFREKTLEQAHEMFKRDADSTEIAEFIKQIAPIYEQYINIGVRIEDDILITKGGNINLSRYAPKEIDDIEQLMR